jgi:hypothetical protein
VPDFDRQPLTPVVFLSRKLACLQIDLSVPVGVEDTGHAFPLLIADTDMHARVGEDVLNPTSQSEHRKTDTISALH